MTVSQFIEDIVHGGFKSFIHKALEKGIQIKIIQEKHPAVIQLSYKQKLLYCSSNNVPLFRRMGNLTTNKNVTKKILKSIGVHTPKGVLAKSYPECIRLMKKIGLTFPLIAKPLDGSLAKGVTWNIQNFKGLRVAFAHAKKSTRKRNEPMVLVEEMFQGNEYRVLVFNKKVISVVQKIPAGVTGDGVSTISQLIHTFNKKRMHGFEIKLDKTALSSLKRAHLTLNSILPSGEFFPFRNNLNMSDGGRAIDVTSHMDPVLKKVCVRSAAAVGLTFGGLDLIAKDIRSIKRGYVILEINPQPYYNMHEKPLAEGAGIDVSSMLLNHIFSN